MASDQRWEGVQPRSSLEFEDLVDLLADNTPSFGIHSPSGSDLSPDLVPELVESVQISELDFTPVNSKTVECQETPSTFFLGREKIAEGPTSQSMAQLLLDADNVSQKVRNIERRNLTKHGTSSAPPPELRTISILILIEDTDDSSLEDPSILRRDDSEEIVRRLKEQIRKERNRASAMRSNMNKLKMRDTLAMELKHSREKARLLRIIKVMLRQENIRLRQSFRPL